MEILRSLTIDKHNLFNSSKNTFYPNSFINLQSSRSSVSDISSIPLKLNIHNQQNKIDFSNAQLKRIIKSNKKMNKYINDDKYSSDIVYKTIKTHHHKKKKEKLIANEDSAIFESIKPKYNQRNQIKSEITKNENEDMVSRGTQCINEEFTSDSNTSLNNTTQFNQNNNKYMKLLNQLKQEKLENKKTINLVNNLHFISLNSTKTTFSIQGKNISYDSKNTPSKIILNRQMSQRKKISNLSSPCLPEIQLNAKTSRLSSNDVTYWRKPSMYGKYTNLLNRKIKNKTGIYRSQSHVNIFNLSDVKLPEKNNNNFHFYHPVNKAQSVVLQKKKKNDESKHQKKNSTLEVKTVKNNLFIDLAKISNVVFHCNNCSNNNCKCEHSNIKEKGRVNIKRQYN